ncbi:unnamed protein product [Prunus armeniaca]
MLELGLNWPKGQPVFVGPTPNPGLGSSLESFPPSLGLSSSVGKFVQLRSTFIGGLIIAFIKVPLLTIVMLSCVPLLVAAGGSISFIIIKAEFRGQRACAKAANVASFTGEKQAITSNNKYLVGAYKSAVHEGSTAGIGHGLVMQGWNHTKGYNGL